MTDLSQLITDALQRARYNEIVQVTIDDTDDSNDDNDTAAAASSQAAISLVACLDRQNGGIVWNPLPTTANNLVLASRHLQTKRWIFPMLNDHRRNKLYATAIQHAAQELAKRYRDNETSSSLAPPTTMHALDIGSGTGLLGMMTRKYLQQAFEKERANITNQQVVVAGVNIQVTSIEMVTCMAQIARQTIQDNSTPHEPAATTSNDFTRVKHALIEGHSLEIPPISPPAVLCVSELLEDGLLGEGILPTIRDAWERHLDSTADALMIPQRARVIVQLVSSNGRSFSVLQGSSDHKNPATNGWLSDWYGPHAATIAQAYQQYCRSACDRNEKDNNRNNNNATKTATFLTPIRLTHDADGSHLLLDASNVVLPVHGGKLLRDGSLIALTEPTQVLDFDFGSPKNNTNDSLESGLRSHRFVMEATSGGKIEGAMVWWELDLWQGLTYSTEPVTLEAQSDDWQDHWHTCLHIFADTQTEVAKGDSVTVQISHTDERIHMQVVQPTVMTEGTSSTSNNKRLKTESSVPTSEALISPMRAHQLNDVHRTATWLQAIDAALLEKGNDSLVLDLSDFCWCACLAASLGATNVVSVESSTNAELAVTSARVAQVANGFPANKSKFDILQCHTEHLNLELLGGGPAEIVMSEYYQVLEGWHLQEALNFFNIVWSLRRRGMLSKMARILPGRCRVMACAIETAQLRSAYKKCGDVQGGLMGFDHSYINQLGGDFSEIDLVLPMWQYEYTRISDHMELACLEFEGSDDDCHHLGQVFTSQAQFTRKGRFDAVMVWLQLEFGSPGGCISLDTCRPSNLQLIRMTKQPEDIFVDGHNRASVECRLAFTEDIFQGYSIESSVTTKD